MNNVNGDNKAKSAEELALEIQRIELERLKRLHQKDLDRDALKLRATSTVKRAVKPVLIWGCVAALVIGIGAAAMHQYESYEEQKSKKLKEEANKYANEMCRREFNNARTCVSSENPVQDDCISVMRSLACVVGHSEDYLNGKR